MKRRDTMAIATQMTELAADAAPVRVVAGWEPETPNFYVHVPEEFSEDAAISLCRRWAQLIRMSVPDKPDEWSSHIRIITPHGKEMGTYAIGWVGHEDTWVAKDEPDMPDTEVWDALYQRLDAYLGAHGRSDSHANGDYFLYDEESGYADQNLTIYRLEFLTRELVSGIQDILKDGYSDWIVYVILDLQPPVAWTSSDGLDIHADRIVERWDRALIASVLGDRLKI
ncbi:MAG: hypothetical protein KF889_15735 [Alphaproteobacteria bacterium]|nr:hypothetical protein [Alphaproteobacteria bacterium]MCW5740179.1 hypothetical protein [Alphaproteobacteria bacterium]